MVTPQGFDVSLSVLINPTISDAYRGQAGIVNERRGPGAGQEEW